VVQEQRSTIAELSRRLAVVEKEVKSKWPYNYILLEFQKAVKQSNAKPILDHSRRIWDEYTMTENIRIHPKSERDRMPIFRFFRFYLWTTGVLTLLTLLSRAFPGATPFSFKHVAIILLCSIPLSILCTFIIEKVGRRLRQNTYLGDIWQL